MARELEVGQIVRSKQGRDKNNLYFVYEILSEDYVLLIDGKRRTIENPKKKKNKHLMVYKYKNNDIIEKLNKREVNNSFIRKSLDSFKNEEKKS